MIESRVRKNTRLKGYDYSQPGSYFITVCTYAREEIFGHVVVGAIHESPLVHLSSEGRIVASVISGIPDRYPAVRLDHFVIMPNHLHMIISIHDERAIRESPLQPGKRSVISQITGYLKMNTTKRIREQNTNVYCVWQRSFHDHIIRNETEYQHIWQYITENPARWRDDRYYVDVNQERRMNT